MSAIGGVVDGIFNIGNTILSHGLAEDREMDARAANYNYGESAADNAQRRQWETINQYYTPSAQLRQLKDAGLSPSLMYGQGGGSVGSGAAAPQGNGAMGISPSSFGVPPSGIAQSVALMAQANKDNAEADRIKGNNERGAAEIAKLCADLGLTNAETNYTNAKTAFQNLQNYITDETKEFTIEQIENEAATSEINMHSAFLEMQKKGIELHISEQTQDAAIEEQKAKVKLLGVQIAESISKRELNNAEKANIEKQTEFIFVNAVHDYAKLKLDTNYQKILQDNVELQTETSTKNTLISTIAHGVCTIAGATVMGILTKSTQGVAIGAMAGESVANSVDGWFTDSTKKTKGENPQWIKPKYHVKGD